jgi:ABC-type sulfate transport system substrate-binding protein
MAEQRQVPIVEIRDFFGMKSAEFAKQWAQLTAGDKAQIKQGLADGSLNY